MVDLLFQGGICAVSIFVLQMHTKVVAARRHVIGLRTKRTVTGSFSWEMLIMEQGDTANMAQEMLSGGASR